MSKLSVMLTAVLAAILIRFASVIVLTLWLGYSKFIFEQRASTLDKSRPEATFASGLDYKFILLSSKEVPILLVAFSIDYLLQDWQDKLLPTRGVRQTKQVLDRQSYQKITDDDFVLEEEIVRKLVAQGRIKRASVNWLNVLCKWFFHLAVTSMVVDFTVGIGIHWFTGQMVHNSSFAEWLILYCYKFALHLLMTEPWFVLLGLVMLPVQYRLPFVKATSLVVNVLIANAVYFNLEWFLQTGFGTRMMATSMANNTQGPFKVPDSTIVASHAYGSEL